MNLIVYGNPEISKNVRSHIERMVGDINSADPQASTLTKVGYFVVDSFNAIADFFAQWAGLKNTITQFEMRSKLQVLTEHLNTSSVLSRESIQSVAEAFFTYSQEVEKETLKWSCLSLLDFSNDPKFRMQIKEALFNLFILTMHALSQARRHPIPPLSEKHVNYLKSIILEPLETIEQPIQPIHNLDQKIDSSSCWTALSTVASRSISLVMLPISIVHQTKQILKSIETSKTLQRTKLVTLWTWTALIYWPWQTLTLPARTTHLVIDKIIPDFLPLKSLMTTVPPCFIAYKTYQLMHNIPLIGPAFHTAVPFLISNIKDLTFQLIKKIAEEWQSV